MSYFACFGYGSLVNTRTLPDGTVVRPASLQGWRRAWRVAGIAPAGKRCSLTAVPDPDCRINGLVVLQHVDRRTELHKREGWYDAAPLSKSHLDWLGPEPRRWPDTAEPVRIFVAKPAHARAGNSEYPVMLSYIDTVVTGYRDRFGLAGVDHFLSTTADWHVPVFDDRHAPNYPRAVSLSKVDRAFVDDHLDRMNVTIVGR